ncbi:MAG: hypothetical protein A2097_03620 [Desulfobacula sp. GWF2_41_7]|jgi:hypothetical protein|nr:MAG: hypothetical protein A2097_03620 [Desulfobacula sp. GWF2_41_7]
MEQRDISNDISTLPPKAQQQVVDFIAFLKTRYKQPKTNRTAKRNEIINEPFIGIWEDRPDMRDSSKWVRNIRKSEWTS